MSRKCGVEKLQLTEYELMYNDLFVDCSDHFFQSWRTKSGCGIPTLDAEVYVALFDLDLWPTTLTYNPRLAKVNIDPHAKNQDQKSNGSNRRATDKWTDTHTHGRYQTCYLPCYAIDKYSVIWKMWSCTLSAITQ